MNGAALLRKRRKSVAPPASPEKKTKVVNAKPLVQGRAPSIRNMKATNKET
jgi:hypothetical protein